MADKVQMTVPLSKMISELSEKHELSKKKLAELFGDFIDLTVKNLKKGNKVRITGLDSTPEMVFRARRLGWEDDTGYVWAQRILARVMSFTDLEPALLGRVEELIDFTTG